MPPKKGKKGKKKGKGKGKDDTPVESEKPKTPEPTEKELLLKAEWVFSLYRSGITLKNILSL